MPKKITIFIISLIFNHISLAQLIPSNKPCAAPTIAVSDTAGILIINKIGYCCNDYSNFLGKEPSCGTAKTDKDAWFKIAPMETGQQYNFLYVEQGNRQTWVEIFELPAGENCNVATNYKSVKCARANNVGFYIGMPVSATFIPSNATSTYFARFQRLNVTDQALEGDFSITRSYPNEEPCGATLLKVQSSKGTKPTSGNNISAADWKPEVLTGPTCGPNNDVWYKFVATSCAMEVFINNLSKNSFEMQAALLTSVEGNCNEQLQVLPCGGQPDEYLDIKLSSDSLTIGKTYYVIIDGYAPLYINAVGNFEIEVYEKNIKGLDCSKLTDLNSDITAYLKIFPNPCNDLLNITTSEQLQNLSILDIAGKQLGYSIGRVSENNYQIKAAQLENGLYFLKGNQENGKIIMQKFVVQH
jgi:Secretion system C-terminal sorting domain